MDSMNRIHPLFGFLKYSKLFMFIHELFLKILAAPTSCCKNNLFCQADRFTNLRWFLCLLTTLKRRIN